MSNNYKSTLQQNNAKLSSNNLDLQSLIDKASALPNAGGDDHTTEDALIMRGYAGTAMELYENDRVSCVGSYALAFVPFTEINLPNALSLGYYAFYNAKVTTLNAPSCKDLGEYTFENCTQLKEVNLCNCERIPRRSFDTCTSLCSISLPSCNTIDENAFYNCRALDSVILANPSIVSLSSTNAFTNTPIASSEITGFYGTIYVPAELVETYKTAKNWSAYADRIKSIDELENETDKLLITFEIENYGQCQAEEGMTWYDWIYSTYNVDNEWYIKSSGMIENWADTVIDGVVATDVIIANHLYNTYLD